MVVVLVVVDRLQHPQHPVVQHPVQQHPVQQHPVVQHPVVQHPGQHW